MKKPITITINNDEKHWKTIAKEVADEIQRDWALDRKDEYIEQQMLNLTMGEKIGLCMLVDGNKHVFTDPVIDMTEDFDGSRGVLSQMAYQAFDYLVSRAISGDK